MADQTTPGRTEFLPPTYLVMAIGLMALLHFTVPVAHWLSWPWRAIGGLPVAAGLVLTLIADGQFKRHATTVKPFQSSRFLVTDGVFALSRHPMYLGMVAALAGLVILLASITPLLVIPVFVWWIQSRFIIPEEKSLSEQFGQAYLEYRSNVRRWV